ncbi:MAG TPA: FAD-dependent oxidoreductase [Solirubrobacterales bacterium]|nr:FAD-dependent oxidoreductase [Solirubrobacterales bacterium]
MVEKAQRRPPRVLIAGGGVAALEAMLALRDLAGDRLEVELCSPCRELFYRPFGIGEPYGAPRILRCDLASLATGLGASFRLGGIFAVAPREGLAVARDGEQIPYDYLLVASGARILGAVPGSVAFWGAAGEGGVGGVMRRLRAGVLRDVLFTMPAGCSWVLPAYELALLGAEVLARSGIEDARVTVVTPEDAPLQIFGSSAGERMGRRLREGGIALVTNASPLEFDGGRLHVASGEPIEAGAVVSLPRLEGRTVDGLSHDGQGFLPVDGHCRVIGTERVFAAGDVTDFPVKRVGVATHGAGVAAATIAAAAGCATDPAPFDPADAPCGPEHDGKVSGRYLVPFLAGLPSGGKRIRASR